MHTVLITPVNRHRRPRALYWLGAASLAAAVTTTLCTVATPAADAARVHDQVGRFADLQQVSDDMLSHERGKFRAGGFDLNLGAQITTLVNNQVALVTNIVDNATGQIQAQIQGGAASHGPIMLNIQNNTGINSNNLPNSNQTNTNTNGNNTGNGNPSFTVTSVSQQSGKTTQVGVNIVGSQGGNASAITTITPTSLVNTIANTTNGLSVVQQVNATVTINNFTAMQHQIMQLQNVSHVLSALQFALTRGIGR